ncbi:hypothetical protein Trydic_g6853 [Trypoxylus dichotomus]
MVNTPLLIFSPTEYASTCEQYTIATAPRRSAEKRPIHSDELVSRERKEIRVSVRAKGRFCGRILVARGTQLIDSGAGRIATHIAH